MRFFLTVLVFLFVSVSIYFDKGLLWMGIIAPLWFLILWNNFFYGKEINEIWDNISSITTNNASLSRKLNIMTILSEYYNGNSLEDLEEIYGIRPNQIMAAKAPNAMGTALTTVLLNKPASCPSTPLPTVHCCIYCIASFHTYT